MSTAAAEDLSPADFVKKIRELGDKRDKEDAERFAALEQEIEKGREERAARRAERARSISPEKSVTPPYSSLRDRNSPSPSPQPPQRAAMAADGTQSPTSLARSGTLSWQQRPKSSSGRRPLSLLAAENAARSPGATPDLTAETAPELSRAQIAESLASKNPAWFKQTAERGVGSAAYRRSQEDPVDTTSGLGKRGLPGMSQESQTAKQSSMSPPPEVARSTSPSRTGSMRSTAGWKNRFSAASSGFDGVNSPLDGPKLAPASESSIGGRSPSPTKGMGGFVQSAMMKRSDSVSKRWSAQAGPGLSRHNSATSNRSGYGGSSSMPRLDAKAPLSPSKDTLNDSESRPNSSHSMDDQADVMDRSGSVKPTMARMHSRSKSVASIRNSIQHEKEDSSQPSSHTKRWSPTKSTWLESALSKEEKAKPKLLPSSAQPPWITERNKAKEQKSVASVDELFSAPAESPPSAQANIEKSRSPPPEPTAKPTSLAGLRSVAVGSESQKTPPPTASPKPVLKPSTNVGKPTAPGKFDFRANLKPRTTAADGNQNQEPEFKNALGKLRRAETKNYVAPDTFKENIMRGKAALAITGGPAKRERVDELKESILKKKQEMKQKVEIEGPTKPEKHMESAVPEALARRDQLSRTDSSDDPPLLKHSAEDVAIPEFLAKQKTLKEKSKPKVPSKPSSPSAEATTHNSVNDETRKTLSTPPDRIPTTTKPAKTTFQPSTVSERSLPQLAGASLKAGTSSKLAERFNPAIAGVLARGPSPMDRRLGGDGSTTNDHRPSVPSDTPNESKELFHMTKGRAKGPKRRAPKAVPAPPVDEGFVPSGDMSTGKNAHKPAMSVPEETAPSGQSKQTPDSSLGVSSETGSVPPAMVKDNLPSSPTARALGSQNQAKSKPVAPSEAPRLSGGTVPAEVPENTAPGVTRALRKSTLQNQQSSLREKGVEDRGQDHLPSYAIERQPLGELTRDTAPAHETISPKRESESSNASVKSMTSLWSKPTQSTPKEQASPSRPSSTSSVLRPSPAIPEKPEPIKTTPRHSHETMSKGWDSTNVQTSATESPTVRHSGSPVKSRSPERRSDDLSNVSVKNAAALWGLQSPTTSTPSRPRSPVKLPSHQDEEKAMRDAGLMPPPETPKSKEKQFGLGLSGAPAHQNITRSPFSPPLSPPLSAGLQIEGTNLAASTKPINASSDAIECGQNGKAGHKWDPSLPQDPPRPQTPDFQKSRPMSTSLKAPPESPIPHTSEANQLFVDFFDDRPVIAAVPEIDTLKVLEADPLKAERIVTLRKQVQEMNSDGKVSSVPSHQEHILFDESMYICTHAFTGAKGARSVEVYLWIGLNASAAVVEDAYAIAKREAKDNAAKLIVLAHGKETPRFFQALGGIVIIFRGQRSKTPSGLSKNFMLCGRSHIGHVSFDEVDFSLNSFCSGFPYLISWNSKLYLWKGRGCNAEELGCSRLIAMDLTANPDVVEIAEGHETPCFLQIFPHLTSPILPPNTMPRSAEHWRLKAGCDKYRCRLFRVRQNDAEPPTKDRSSLQVSSFFGGVLNSAASSVVTRKRSWSSMLPRSGSNSPTHEPQTPTTPTGGPLWSPTRLGFGGRPSTPTTPPSPITEIAPFSQRDLEPEGIFVLDAFFEIYVLIGSLAQSQSRAFATALLFAQDYGILAASMEDRPFVPVSTVVLEGAPKDMKAVFRQWSDQMMLPPTQALMKAMPRRAGSLRCVGLSAALAATRPEKGR